MKIRHIDATSVVCIRGTGDQPDLIQGLDSQNNWQVGPPPIYVRTTALLWTKLSIALLTCAEIAFLGVKVTLSRRRTNVTLAAAAIDLLASLCIGYIIHADHQQSLRSSAWLSVFFLVNLLTDAARSRSYFLRSGLATLGALAAATSSLKLTLLALQDMSKQSLLIDDALQEDSGPEATCGPLRRLLFVFLYPIFEIGFRGPLLMHHLHLLDPRTVVSDSSQTTVGET
ncbi:hypothetical protein MY10362_007994 [Beauveria mimosiformis]